MSSEDGFSVSWVEIEGRTYAVARHKGGAGISYDLLDYSIHLSRRLALTSLTVRSIVYHLTPFLSWLTSLCYTLDKVGDGTVIDFRDAEYQRLLARKKASSKAHKRTVNSRVVCIYNFMVWYQWRRPDFAKLVGQRNAQLTTTLYCDTSGKLIKNKNLRGGFYPALFSDAGAGARHRPIYKATEKDCDDIKSEFLVYHDDYIASRNIVLMEIMEQVGLRRASVNSLRCSQFDIPEDYFQYNDSLSVVPDSQKFGYEKSFKFSEVLVLKIKRFIDVARKDFLEKKCRGIDRSGGRVFISSISGRALTNAAVTRIFSSAFDRIGITERASCHAFRHKFANDEISDEILLRKEAGIDTSDASIAYSVAPRMGHSNPESLMSYVANAQIEIATNLRRENYEIKELKEENARLRAQLEKQNLEK
ncbi:TPA: site-specific integrase [Pseudomonas aeruginosa]|nr:site-specific integrase [Pseudomonas aeruginosa]